MNKHFRTLLSLALSGVLILSSTAYAQIVEVEPNHPCSNAQNIGAISLPFTQYGSLDSEESQHEGDYFRFTGTPGEWVEVALEGEATGKGTLPDPNLAFLGSSCNEVIAFNENIGENNNSKLILIIPADGVFIMAANGYGTGTYQMTISPFVRTNVEIERNHPCSNAQNIGAITLPFTINGSLDSTPESPDVDFFRFTGTPGEWVYVDLEGASTGKGTLETPVVGVFDTSCNPLKSNDGSRLDLKIPTDGEFIVGATGHPDYEFQGGVSGTYQITIRPYVSIGSISGQVIDALTGDPLRGDIAPFADVGLSRIDESNSFEHTSYQHTDSEGRFRFTTTYSGKPLIPGMYSICAGAEEYFGTCTELMPVTEGEDLDVGNIPLQPHSIQLTDILPCNNVPSKGGMCRYSVKVTNNLSTPFYGKAWSLVNINGINSVIGFTTFQANTVPLKLKSRKSTIVQFEFRVPAEVLDAASICANVYVGQYPHASFNTVGYKDQLFCITKGDSEFEVMPKKKTQEMSLQRNGKTAQRTAAQAKVRNISR